MGPHRISTIVYTVYCSFYCCCSSCWGRPLTKSLKLRRFKSDRDEIRQECSSNEESDFGCDVTTFVERHSAVASEALAEQVS